MAPRIHTLVLYQGRSDERSTVGLVFTHDQGFETVQAALISLRMAYQESVEKDQKSVKLDDCCIRTLNKTSQARFCTTCGHSVIPNIPSAGEKFAEHLFGHRGDQYSLEATLLDAGWDMDLGGTVAPDWKHLVAIEGAEEHLDNCAYWDYRRYIDAGDDTDRSCTESDAVLDIMCHDEDLSQYIFTPF